MRRWVAHCAYVAGAAAFCCAPVVVSAQATWKPDRAVEIISGTAPGSAPDRMARVIQEILRGKPNVPVPTTVVNRPGAGGAKGWVYLNQHAGDAHYLMIAAGNLSVGYLTGTSTISHRDVTPVALLAHEYIALSVRVDSPIKDGKDLVERLKKDPGSLSLGVSSVAGSMTHIGGALPIKAAGVDLRKVRTVVFDSAGRSMTAMLGGHVDVVAGSISISLAQLRNGKTRILGYSAPRRLGNELAQIPTWREQGLDVNFSNYRGVMGPRQLNGAQVAYWEGVFREVDADERWRADLDKNNLDRDFMGAQETRHYWEGLVAPIKAILSDAGLVK
jgi:putative tricarboxylic transport membrane protein